MSKVNSIWPITLVGMNSREGVTREFVTNTVAILSMWKTKERREHSAKQKVMGLRG